MSGLLASLDFGPVWDQRERLLSGIGTMLYVAVISMLLSVVGGLLLATMRRSRLRPINALGFLLIQACRGIALYVLILWLFYGLAAGTGIRLDPIPTGIFALTLLNSGYMAEIFRAGFDAIPEGQREAATALGLGPVTSMARIQAPQAIQITLPATGNIFVDIIKDTSILALVGVSELLRESQTWAQYYSRSFEFYVAAAAIYVGVVLLVSFGWRYLERYAGRHLHIEPLRGQRRWLFGMVRT
ncbi:MAG: amino acid ABC transporter permease [Actinobacteria bacterium]|nr:amino acid ABC transporter permease [Actinomycetota bacterium]